MNFFAISLALAAFSGFAKASYRQSSDKTKQGGFGGHRIPGTEHINPNTVIGLPPAEVEKAIRNSTRNPGK